MNPAIKRKQTLLAKWLISKLQCTHKTAETGTQYLVLKTKYTGTTTVRVSDHFSKSSEPETIHVIISSINNDVIINYRNFMWTGDFAIAKHIVYTLMMTVAIPGPTIVSKKPEAITIAGDVVKIRKKDSLEKYLPSWGKVLGTKIKEISIKHPELATELVALVKGGTAAQMDYKIELWHKFKKEFHIAQSNKSYF